MPSISNSFDAPPSIPYIQLQLYMGLCVYRRKCYTSTALQLQQQQSSKLYTKKVISSRLVSRFITPIKLQDVWFLMCGKACTIITDRRKNHYSHHSWACARARLHTQTQSTSTTLVVIDMSTTNLPSVRIVFRLFFHGFNWVWEIGQHVLYPKRL